MCASKNRMRVTHALLKVCVLFGCQLHHRHAIANVSTQVGRICILVLYNNIIEKSKTLTRRSYSVHNLRYSNRLTCYRNCLCSRSSTSCRIGSPRTSAPTQCYSDWRHFGVSTITTKIMTYPARHPRLRQESLLYRFTQKRDYIYSYYGVIRSRRLVILAILYSRTSADQTFSQRVTIIRETSSVNS